MVLVSVVITVQHEIFHYPASRGFSLVFLSVVLPFSSLLEKTSADSCLGFLLSMREMKMPLPGNFCVTCQ